METKNGLPSGLPDPCILLGGQPRSGTTLLSSMLGSCPTHFQAYELHIRKPSFVKGLGGRYTRNIFKELGLPPKTYDKIIAAATMDGMNLGAWTGPKEDISAEPLTGLETDDFPQELYRRGTLVTELMRATCRQAGSQTWGFKILGDIIFMDVYHAVWPNAVFIFLVRDPRDNAMSILKLNEQRQQRQQPNFYDNLYVAAEGWKRTIEGVRQQQKNCDARCVVIRYEDLVTSPKTSLQELQAQLNLDLSNALEFYKQSIVKDHARRFQHHANILRPVSPDSVGKWKKEFDQSENDIFWEVAGDLMEEYHYERG